MSPEPSSGPALFVVNVEAFVWRDGRYLMAVRGATEEIAPGALVPPGGKLEADEGPEDALAGALSREVREEVGVEVADAAFVESHVFTGTFGGRPLPILDLVFWCRYVAGEPRAQDEDEIAGVEWLTVDEIRRDLRAMPWTVASLDRAEAVRLALGRPG